MATLDLSVQPKKVTIENGSDAPVVIQFYRNYNAITIPAGDSLVVKTEHSAEEAYYLSLATAKVTCTSSSL